MPDPLSKSRQTSGFDNGGVLFSKRGELPTDKWKHPGFLIVWTLTTRIDRTTADFHAKHSHTLYLDRLRRISVGLP